MFKQNVHYVRSETSVSPERLFAATLLQTNSTDLKQANKNDGLPAVGRCETVASCMGTHCASDAAGVSD